MARTRLFGQLQRLVRTCGGSSLASYTAARQPEERSRRHFLGALGGLSVMGLGLVPACTQALPPAPASQAQATRRSARIAIVGAGIAGLHAAYRLREVGLSATVYEASSRAGGRIFTDREHFGTQVAELGGEFIDSGHTTLHTLAKELKIELDDRQQLLAAVTHKEVWWLAGHAVPEETVSEQFRHVAPLLADLLARIEEQGDDALFAQLDSTTLSAWLNEHVPSGTYPELHAILNSAYRGEYGRETTEQSALNLLYLIGHDASEFAVFGDSDERFHTRNGNQTFTDRLAAALPGQLQTKHKLTQISGQSTGPFELRFENGSAAGVTVVTDHVVFTLPFSVLREVDLSKLELPSAKRELIAQLGYGNNAKLMGQFASRLWSLQHNAAGSVTSDAAFQQCWDTSVGQPSELGLLTNFLGGAAGEHAGEGSEQALYQKFVTELEAVFPGVAAAWSGRAVRMHWPSHAYARGSYACYLPGQWRFWGQEGQRVGNVHFAGEHTSLDFQGFMEGGAESGARVAGEILKDLELTPSAIHEALLELGRDLPWQSPTGTPLWVARRRARVARLSAHLNSEQKLS